MDDEAKITVAVAQQELRVGSKDSKLSIAVTNPTDTDGSWVFYLTLPAGFVTADSIGDIDFIPVAEIDQPPNRSADPGETTWRVGDARGTTIRAGKTESITLSKLNVAAAGVQQIRLEWFDALLAPAGDVQSDVTVLGDAERPKINSFTADQEIFTRQASKQVSLSWDTDADYVTLKRYDDTLLDRSTDVVASDWSDTGTEGMTGVLAYLLEASVGTRSVSRWLFVRIEAPGWNRIPECTQGSPTLLLTDGSSKLYGVFVTGARAAVYSLDPTKSTLGQRDEGLRKGEVPEGMEKSPGVFFNTRIWLVGGSQIDPDVCSNMVWSFDPLDPQAERSEPHAANWTPRMGHACVAFNSQLWILGGMDDNGNPLKEIWSSQDGVTWTQHQTPSAWTGPCLMGAAAVGKRLYVYGGADEPFGTPQTGLFYTTDGETWTPQAFQGVPPGDASFIGRPFGSALCPATFQSKPYLHILGTFLQPRTAVFSSGAFRLSGDSLKPIQPGPETNGWSTKGDEGSLQQAFRLSAVGVAVKTGAFIFVVPVLYDANPRSMTYYVIP